jgi:hypothetical protein
MLRSALLALLHPTLVSRSRLRLSQVASFGILLAPISLFPKIQAASFSSYYYPNMNHISERDGSGTITMTPKNDADQSALLVICHGLGDTADGFDDVAEV